MDFRNMTKEEAIDYCYRHRDEYIKGDDSIDAGIRNFDCMVAMLEYGSLKPTELPEYGMDYED